MTNLKYNFYTPDNRLVSSDYLIEIIENNLHCFDEYDLLKNSNGGTKGRGQLNTIYLNFINTQVSATYKGWSIAEHLYPNVKVVKRHIIKPRLSPTPYLTKKSIGKRDYTNLKKARSVSKNNLNTIKKSSKSRINGTSYLVPYYLKSPNNQVFIGSGLVKFVSENKELFNQTDLNKSYSKKLNTDNRDNAATHGLYGLNSGERKSWKGWTRPTESEIEQHLKQTT